MRLRFGLCVALMTVEFILPSQLDAESTQAVVSANEYPSIQEAIDAHPGVMIQIPPGRHVIQQTIRLTTNGSGLYGYGTIVQENPDQPLLLIDGASEIRIEGITLTRQVSDQRITADGILCRNARNVTITGVQVLDNRSQAAAVRFDESEDCALQDSSIINYKTIGIDDRTANPLLGYAFHCIDGSGIVVTHSRRIAILDNQVMERALVPSREIFEKHGLGKLTDGAHPTKLGDLGRRAVDGDHVNNWHQGSAIVATSPTETSHLLIRGNRLLNAAQGIDLHCDDSIISDNVIDHCMIGLKATHGSRNLILKGNLITHVDLWGIVVNPGASSSAGETVKENVPAKEPNVDAGIVIASNIITHYGDGDEYWNWGGKHEDRGSSYAIAFMERQLPSNPLLQDILVEGNIVYDTSRDMPGATSGSAKYRYAVLIEKNSAVPGGIQFWGNIFHPGKTGISNIPLDHAADSVRK